ncbi:Nitrogen regulatory protein P-II like [Apostasia shenzhenica]|uniref:Nitrogen regulatory protein P-II like n=1 Tax=Apostasia shenzhenica TaxID=1088818 RepID=A0A2H9ZXY0_9ASPA|nr:Nitrogen regulatory protein P-II like [Apostasia shenzhenica]
MAVALSNAPRPMALKPIDSPPTDSHLLVFNFKSSLTTPPPLGVKLQLPGRPSVLPGLLKMGIRGVTVSDVKGFGAQGGSLERHGGKRPKLLPNANVLRRRDGAIRGLPPRSEFSEDSFVAKVKMEIVVSKDQVEEVINKIIEEARTGEIGDGKIFLIVTRTEFIVFAAVIPVSDVIRVRTGERGEKGERMTGGRADMISAARN